MKRYYLKLSSRIGTTESMRHLYSLIVILIYRIDSTGFHDIKIISKYEKFSK